MAARWWWGRGATGRWGAELRRSWRGRRRHGRRRPRRRRALAGAGRGGAVGATVVEAGAAQTSGWAETGQGGGKAPNLPAVPGGGARAPVEARSGGAAVPRAEAQAVAATAAGAKADEGAASADAKEAVRGADPDTAAMAILRAAVAAKRWPEPAAVGAQALLNYFTGEAEAVVASLEEVAVAVEVAEAPWAPERKLVRVAVRAAPPKTPRAATANLVLLVDVSRSMDAPNRLPLVQEAARRLLHDLKAEDRVAIVTYAGEARVALPPTPMSRAADVRAALAGLRAEGMTNGAAGLRRAYELARAGFVVGGVNRVVLCTDGDFNMGVTSEAELGALVEAEAKGGIGLGVFGFGRGRAIDPRLEALATKGRGGSGHVNTRREAERRMAAEVNGWNATEVRGVQLGLTGDPARIAASRLVGHDESFLPPEDVGRKTMEVSELAPGEAITALFEIVPKVGERAGTGPGAGTVTGADGGTDWLTLNVGYRVGEANGGEARSMRVPVRESGRRWAEASAEFKISAAVAGLGLALRERPVDRAKLAAVVRWAEEAAASGAPDPGGYGEEFLALAREVRELAK
jgi:Ca-activated chloride channel family protein